MFKWQTHSLKYTAIEIAKQANYMVLRILDLAIEQKAKSELIERTYQ